MSRFLLSDRAKADIHDIWDYIGIENESPSAAYRQVEILYEKLTLLATQPLMGQLRADLRPDLRTFAAGSYVILYYAREDEIDVAAIVHGARDVESMFQARRDELD